MEFHANNRLSLAVVADFNAYYDRANHISPTAPTSSKRINNRLTL